MQTILQTREHLLDKLRLVEEAGDLDTAAMLEYGITEFDGVVALLASLTRRGPTLLH